MCRLQRLHCAALQQQRPSGIMSAAALPPAGSCQPRLDSSSGVGVGGISPVLLELDKAVAGTGACDPVFDDLNLCHRAQGCENALQASKGTRSTLMSRWGSGRKEAQRGREA